MNFHTAEFSDLPLYQWILIAVILFTQSIWLFTDAQKRNAKHWFWGIWGLLSAPMPLVLYMIFVRKIFKKKSSE